MSDNPQAPPAAIAPAISRFASTRPGTPSLSNVVTYLILLPLPLCQALPNPPRSTSIFESPVSCVRVIVLNRALLPLLGTVALLNSLLVHRPPLLRLPSKFQMSLILHNRSLKSRKRTRKIRRPIRSSVMQPAIRLKMCSRRQSTQCVATTNMTSLSYHSF